MARPSPVMRMASLRSIVFDARRHDEHGGRRRDRVSPCLQARPRGHCLKAQRLRVSLRPIARLAQNEERGRTSKAKQPYAIAMKDSSPFGIAGIWENWKEPSSREWIRT